MATRDFRICSRRKNKRQPALLFRGGDFLDPPGLPQRDTEEEAQNPAVQRLPNRAPRVELLADHKAVVVHRHDPQDLLGPGGESQDEVLLAVLSQVPRSSVDPSRAAIPMRVQEWSGLSSKPVRPRDGGNGKLAGRYTFSVLVSSSWEWSQSSRSRREPAAC
jgi:hypothetical protein